MSERMSVQTLMMRLDSVFTLDELVAASGWDRHYARNTVQRFRDSGHVEFAGPRAGVYFNRQKLGLEPCRDDPGDGVTATSRAVAASKAYPGSVLVGEIPLYHAGWISAPSRGLARVALRRTRDVNPRASLDGVSRVSRSAGWWREVAPRASPSLGDGPDDPWLGAPALPPHLALADAFVHGIDGEVAPDAIDFESDWRDREPEEIVELVREGLELMDSPPEATARLDEVAAAHGVVSMRP